MIIKADYIKRNKIHRPVRPAEKEILKEKHLVVIKAEYIKKGSMGNVFLF